MILRSHPIVTALSCVLVVAAPQARCAESDDAEALRKRIRDLERELAEARNRLSAIEAPAAPDPSPSADSPMDAAASLEPADPADPEFRIGRLHFGGAMRVNYVLGDYRSDGGSGPQRSGDGGNFELDIFRLNLDYNPERSGFTAKSEYRFLDGYNFAHTAWAGWRFEDDSLLRVGLNRVPFGAGPYGTSHNWFFDQGYYVGLTDDMDVGLSYTRSDGPWTLDFGYYAAAEPNFFGDSTDSARYSYDIVDNGSPHAHYRERHQVNVRGIHRLVLGEEHTLDLGASLQAGLLKADPRFASDSHQLAAAIHATWRRGPWEVVGQLSAWDYAADYHPGSGLSDSLIGMGAYDFENPVASRALLPALGIAYTWETGHLGWLDSITFYNDFSVILKDGSDPAGARLNDSVLNVLGMSFSRDNWLIYCDWAWSNGNYFVGDKSFTDFGANAGQRWQWRLNLNFGYYY